MAEWVAQSGRVWDNWSEDEWPSGNVHWHRWNPSLPWPLSVDLGLRSAWQVWQQLPATDKDGRRLMTGNVDVLVHEWTPDDGDVESMAQRLLAELDGSIPSRLVAGADITTRSTINRKTAQHAILQAFGRPVMVQSPSGDHASKELQYYTAKGLIKNAKGVRRACVSKHLQTHDRHGRGFKDMVDLDVWPDLSRARTEFLNKDKGRGIGLEDTRDAWLYYAICTHPPQWRVNPDSIGEVRSWQ